MTSFALLRGGVRFVAITPPHVDPRRGKMPPPVAAPYTTEPTPAADPRGEGVARAVERMNAGHEPRLGSAKWQP